MRRADAGRYLPALFFMATVWVTIAVTDLDHYLVAAQVAALKTAAMASGQSAVFSEVMPRVVARIRSQIQACPSYRVSATASSVPPSLKDYACFLILEEMSLRLPSLRFTEQQAKMADTARSYMRDVAKCDARIEEPTDPLEPPDVQSSSAVEVVSSSTRVATRDTLSGL